jgi:hypothetical protein
MSRSRKLALVFTLALATIAMTAAAALAQGGSPNPSGGTTICRPAVEEGPGSAGLGGYLPKGFVIDLGVRSWLNAFAPSRYAVPTARHPVNHPALSAVAPRRVWSR